MSAQSNDDSANFGATNANVKEDVGEAALLLFLLLLSWLFHNLFLFLFFFLLFFLFLFLDLLLLNLFSGLLDNFGFRRFNCDNFLVFIIIARFILSLFSNSIFDLRGNFFCSSFFFSFSLGLDSLLGLLGFLFVDDFILYSFLNSSKLFSFSFLLSSVEFTSKRDNFISLTASVIFAEVFSINLTASLDVALEVFDLGQVFDIEALGNICVC